MNVLCPEGILIYKSMSQDITAPEWWCDGCATEAATGPLRVRGTLAGGVQYSSTNIIRTRSRWTESD